MPRRPSVATVPERDSSPQAALTVWQANAAEAVEWLVRAGRRAPDLAALAAAIDYFTPALRLAAGSGRDQPLGRV